MLPSGLRRALGRKPRSATSERPPLLLLPGSTLTGAIRHDGLVRLEGALIGSIEAPEIEIGATGCLRGHARADGRLTIDGKLDGIATGRGVEIRRGAEVRGEVHHANLEVQPNSTVFLTYAGPPPAPHFDILQSAFQHNLSPPPAALTDQSDD